MNIKENLAAVKAELPEGVMLVAVSKYHPKEAVQEAYEAGQRVFGESHAQEITEKEAALPKDIQWHFIGHLQTNKVKYIAPYITLIHSVDSVKLLNEINKQAAKCERTIDCLLQMHIAQEETKYGFSPEELKVMLTSDEWKQLKNVRIVGLMCMATNTEDESQIKAEFAYARSVFENVKAEFFSADDNFKELSMGMSGDYHLAVQHGSTMVRVGSKIFGNRIYN